MGRALGRAPRATMKHPLRSDNSQGGGPGAVANLRSRSFSKKPNRWFPKFSQISNDFGGVTQEGFFVCKLHVPNISLNAQSAVPNRAWCPGGGDWGRRFLKTPSCVTPPRGGCSSQLGHWASSSCMTVCPCELCPQRSCPQGPMGAYSIVVP